MTRLKPMKLWLGGVLPLFFSLAMSRPADAQVLYGSVVGTVTDSNGASIADATIQVIQRGTGWASHANTNASGGYTLSTIPGGYYEFTLSKVGFATYVQKELFVRVNDVTRLDIELKVGSSTESVVVNEQPPVLQTDRAGGRVELSNTVLNGLPLAPGHNFQSLLSIEPGFSPPIKYNSFGAAPQQTISFNVNGTSASGIDMRIDGASVHNVYYGHASVFVPPLEAIADVNADTSSYSAEQGLSGGAAINVVMKSGTNQLHGSGYWYNFNNHTMAKPRFFPIGKANPKNIVNEFGGSLGGPIRRDNLFFFSTYERKTNHQTGSSFATVPTAAMRSGDMSASQIPIYDPTTGNPDGSNRTPFPGNVIQPNRLSPIVQKLVALTPLPNIPNQLSNNYFVSAPFAFDTHTGYAKVSWNASKKLLMFGDVGVFQSTLSNETVFGQLGGPTVNGGGFGGSSSSYVGVAGGVYTVTPNLVLDTHFGYTLADTNDLPIRLGENLGLDFLGIPGTNGPTRNYGGWPVFRISNFTTLGSTDNSRPIIYHDLSWEYTAGASWIRGNHHVQFGVDLIRQHMNHISSELIGNPAGGAGGFVFSGGPTSILGGKSPNGFNSYAAFLLGLPSEIGKVNQGPPEFTSRNWLIGSYISDLWMATHKLTFSYGLRWENYPFPTRSDRGLERYDVATNKMLICGIGTVPRDCGVSVSNKLFAPRLGAAYRPTETFVMRAGYGITYDPFNELTEAMLVNYPEAIGLDLNGPNSYQPAGSLSNGIPAIVAPDLGNGIIDVPGNVQVSTVADRYKQSYIESWNVSLEKQLIGGFTAQAAYVGSRQVQETGFTDLNVGTPGGGLASEPLFQQFGRTAPTQVTMGLGTSHYDALQATLRHRFDKGYEISTSYTLSKATAVCCGSGLSGLDYTPAIQTPKFYKLNRALADSDRTHNVQIASILELPFGEGKRWANSGGGLTALTSRWRVSGIFTLLSGTPFSILSDGTSLNAPGNVQRADQVKPKVKKLGGIGPSLAYYDPLAFAPVTEPRFGTAGFNILRGPGVVNLNLSLSREFALKDRAQLQIRADAYNLTNTPHFGNPGGNVSNMTLNPDGTINSLGGYMQVTSVGSFAGALGGIDQRLFNFGLRISF